MKIQTENSPADTTPPTILNGPANMAVTGQANQNSVFVSWRAPTAMDPSGVASATNNVDFETQATLLYGMAQMVEYTFTDAQGNTNTHAFFISGSCE